LESGFPVVLVAALFGVVPSVHGQWSTSGSSVYYNGGNVGIGTTSPSSLDRLDVVGKVRIRDGNATYWGWELSTDPSANFDLSYWGGNYAQHVIYASYATGYVGIGTVSPGAPLETYTGNSTLPGLRLRRYPTGAYYTDLSHTVNANGVDGLAVLVGNGTATNEIVRFNANGNVGIGTANPQYLLSVKGTIGTQELVVTNTGWSDYVFRPGYRLLPLSQVKTFIDAHHHLPDIPSEDEVKENGANVGEMQAKLLAKIEELTLYMIEAEQNNSKLAQEVADLKRESGLLRERIARIEAPHNARGADDSEPQGRKNQ
jgi:hypothetical protein